MSKCLHAVLVHLWIKPYAGALGTPNTALRLNVMVLVNVSCRGTYLPMHATNLLRADSGVLSFYYGFAQVLQNVNQTTRLRILLKSCH